MKINQRQASQEIPWSFEKTKRSLVQKQAKRVMNVMALVFFSVFSTLLLADQIVISLLEPPKNNTFSSLSTYTIEDIHLPSMIIPVLHVNIDQIK